MDMPDNISPQDISERAWQAYRSRDYAAAAGTFAEAASAYAARGDVLDSAEMKNNQSVALLRAKQAKAALEAAGGTEAVFAGAGDSRREGIALANQASALQALRQFGDAMRFYTRAGEALEKAGEDVLRLQVMQLLATLYLSRFKFFDAIIALQSGLAGVKNPTPRQRLMKKFLFIRL
jgi:tetratricopeptide (TPR) repeat protein